MRLVFLVLGAASAVDRQDFETASVQPKHALRRMLPLLRPSAAFQVHPLAGPVAVAPRGRTTAAQVAPVGILRALDSDAPRRRAVVIARAAASEDGWMQSFDFAGATDEEVSEASREVFAHIARESVELMRSPFTSALASVVQRPGQTLPGLVAAVLASKLKFADLPGAVRGARGNLVEHTDAMEETFTEVLSMPTVLRGIVGDLIKAYVVDPALDGLLAPALFFKGFAALATHRVAHVLWERGERAAALLLQSRASELFAVDIHPGAQIGSGVMLDHATGVVIGSTAVLGDDLYILHQVTLGATGKETPGKRHPTVGSHVVLGTGSTVLGNIRVGDGATIGAKAIVTKEVPDGATVIEVNKLVDKPDGVATGAWMFEI